LTTNAVAALNADAIMALSSSQFAALTTSQLDALSLTQIDVLTTDQTMALTVEQTVALTGSSTTSDVSALIDGFTSYTGGLYTPIVLDMNGDGISTLSYSSGVQFDLHADGLQVQTGWASATDGLLALDRNQDGQINDGSELFGSATMLSTGEKAKDGYEALRDLDTDKDNSITRADAQWVDLKVWQDRNSDGISQDGELVSLDSLGITQLDLNAQSTAINDNGNVIGLTSSYQTNDGASHDMADVWFVADKPISSQVSELTQAITAFDAEQDALNESSGSTLPQLGEPMLPTGGSLAGMVDLLKQFDQNGNPVIGSTPTLGAAQAGLTEPSSLTTVQDPIKTGFLAS
jgi:hypothetical protein